PSPPPPENTTAPATTSTSAAAAAAIHSQRGVPRSWSASTVIERSAAACHSASVSTPRSTASRAARALRLSSSSIGSRLQPLPDRCPRLVERRLDRPGGHPEQPGDLVDREILGVIEGGDRPLALRERTDQLPPLVDGGLAAGRFAGVAEPSQRTLLGLG